MQRCRLFFVIVCLIASASALQAKQLAVVTGNDNSVATLSSADLQKLFALHTHAWPNGKPVIVVMRDPASSDMALVLRKVLNMTPEQANAFVQAHKGSVVVAASDEAVIRFVASNHGAIGIVDLYSLTKDVRVLKIDGKLPVEQGYFLRGNE